MVVNTNSNCVMCKEKFLSKSHLDLHIKTSHLKMLVCSKCPYFTTLLKIRMIRHLKISHQGTPIPEDLENLIALNKKYITPPETTTKELQSKIPQPKPVDDFFKSKPDHEDLEDENSRFSCEKCWFTAENKEQLTQHEKDKHYISPDLGNMLSSPTPLPLLDIPTDPTFVPVPESEPASGGGLTEIEIINAAFNQSIFECYHCWFTFDTSHMLAQHITSVHGASVKVISSFDDGISDQFTNNLSSPETYSQPSFIELQPSNCSSYQPDENAHASSQSSNTDVVILDGECPKVESQLHYTNMESNINKYFPTVNKDPSKGMNRVDDTYLEIPSNMNSNSTDNKFQTTSKNPQQFAKEIQLSEIKGKLFQKEAQGDQMDDIFETVAEFKPCVVDIYAGENPNTKMPACKENKVVSPHDGNNSFSNVDKSLNILEINEVPQPNTTNTETLAQTALKNLSQHSINHEYTTNESQRLPQTATDTVFITRPDSPTDLKEQQQLEDILANPDGSPIHLPESAELPPQQQKDNSDLLNLSANVIDSCSLQLRQAPITVQLSKPEIFKSEQTQITLPELTDMESIDSIEDLIKFNSNSMQSTSNHVPTNTAEAVQLLDEFYRQSMEDVQKSDIFKLEYDVQSKELKNESISEIPEISFEASNANNPVENTFEKAKDKEAIGQKININHLPEITIGSTIPAQSQTVQYTIECSLCDYSTEKPSEMETHLSWEGHFSLGQENICQHCTYMSTTKEELIEHGQSHDKFFSLSDFVCLKCDFKGENSDKINQHWNKTHNIYTEKK